MTKEESLQKKLSDLAEKQEKKKAPMWYYTIDVINEMQEAVRSCAKEIQGRIDIITKEIEPLEKSIVNLTQEHRIRLEWLYGYRLAKQEDKKLLVSKEDIEK